MAPSGAYAAALMTGFEEAYRGREITGLPEEVMRALADSGQTPLIVRVRQGDPAAVSQALATLASKQSPLNERVFYARSAARIQPRSPSRSSANSRRSWSRSR
jgi:hypothetical protein